ncbi:MAG: hypothetical protein N3A01_02765 [Bacteroidales bacterium]|nr:hypothetical protein [Bacteroidales bacterium]
MKRKLYLTVVVSVLIFFLIIFFLKEKILNNSIIVQKVYFSNNEIVTIYNNTNTEVNFNFKLNNLFFYSTNDIINTALQIKNENHDFKKIFNLITESLVQNSTFNSWELNPLSIINSLGYALCDKQSAIYGLLCKKIGYEAKLVELTGHVMCEIKDKNNKKILVDVSHKHFFKLNNRLLSYKDIVNKPEVLKLITDSLNSKIANFSSLKPKYYNIIRTTSDNFFRNINWKFKDTFLITLPPKSYFSFPYKPNYTTDIYPYNTKAKLKFSEFNEYLIKNNTLVIIDFEGKGVVKIKNKTFNLPYDREKLQFYLTKSNYPLKTITVIPKDTNFAIIYALNPRFTKLSNQNELLVNSDKILKIKKFKYKKLDGDFEANHIQWLDHYSYEILNFYKKNKHLKFNKFVEAYSLLKNNSLTFDNKPTIDTIKIKTRLIAIDSLIINSNIGDFDEIKTFILGLAIFLNDQEFSIIFKQFSRRFAIDKKYNNYFYRK